MKTISENIHWIKYVFIGFSTIGMIGCIISLFLVEGSPELKFITTLISTIIIASSMLYNPVQNVRFDQKEMSYYLKGETCSIPLQSIYEVSETFLKIGKRNLWVIKFINKQDEEDSIRLLPIKNPAFEEFRRLCKLN